MRWCGHAKQCPQHELSVSWERSFITQSRVLNKLSDSMSIDAINVNEDLHTLNPKPRPKFIQILIGKRWAHTCANLDSPPDFRWDSTAFRLIIFEQAFCIIMNFTFYRAHHSRLLKILEPVWRSAIKSEKSIAEFMSNNTCKKKKTWNKMLMTEDKNKISDHAAFLPRTRHLSDDLAAHLHDLYNIMYSLRLRLIREILLYSDSFVSRCCRRLMSIMCRNAKAE